MSVSLPDDTTQQFVASLQTYFREERDEEVGELQASLLLEFILAEIGPRATTRPSATRMRTLAAPWPTST